MRSHDPLILRDAQLKILDRRRHRVLRRGTGPVPTPTPNTSTALRSPSFLTTPVGSVVGSVGAPEEEDDVADALSLDGFFSRFTSPSPSGKSIRRRGWKRGSSRARPRGEAAAAR